MAITISSLLFALFTIATIFPRAVDCGNNDPCLEEGPIPNFTNQASMPEMCKFLQQPPPPPPPGPPNYVDPLTLAPVVLGTTCVFLVIALIAVLSRCVSQTKLLTRLYIEDWLAILAWSFSFAMTFFINWSTRIGMGRHWWDVPPDWLEKMHVPGPYLTSIFYLASITAIKSSILFFFLRLGKGMGKIFQVPCAILLASVICAGTTSTFLLAFYCQPIAAIWNQMLLLPKECGGVGAKCLNSFKLQMAVGVMNLMSNFLIISLMVVLLGSLRKQRFSIAVLSGFIGLILAACTMRIYFVCEVERTQDGPWIGALNAVCSSVEVNVTIIVASLPQIKTLLSHILLDSPGSNASIGQVNNQSLGLKEDGEDGIAMVNLEGQSNNVTNVHPQAKVVARGDSKTYPKYYSTNGNRNLRNIRGYAWGRSDSQRRPAKELSPYDPRNIYRGDLAGPYDEEFWDDAWLSKDKDGSYWHPGPHSHHHGGRVLGNYVSTIKAGTSSEERILSGSEDLEIAHDGIAITKTTEVRIDIVSRGYSRNGTELGAVSGDGDVITTCSKGEQSSNTFSRKEGE